MTSLPLNIIYSNKVEIHTRITKNVQSSQGSYGKRYYLRTNRTVLRILLFEGLLNWKIKKNDYFTSDS